jgi:hypothetical protein
MMSLVNPRTVAAGEPSWSSNILYGVGKIIVSVITAIVPRGRS